MTGVVAGTTIAAAIILATLSEASAVTIIVAGLGALGLVISSWVSARRAGEAKDAIGTPNGHGNVVQMLTSLLDGQVRQDRRLARSEEWRGDAETWRHNADDRLRLLELSRDEHGHRLDGIDGRLAAIEPEATPE